MAVLCHVVPSHTDVYIERARKKIIHILLFGLSLDPFHINVSLIFWIRAPQKSKKNDGQNILSFSIRFLHSSGKKWDVQKPVCLSTLNKSTPKLTFT
jgi:hypothetical protein